MSDTHRPGRYAVVGNPVGHSLSPRIHAAFAAQTGQAMTYEAIEIAVGGFEAGIRDLRARGYAGLNVTVPFKQDAWRLCDTLSERAQLAGAVNTLVFGGETDVRGDNTDGVGLVRDLLDNLGIAVEGRRLLLLGAGGAVRGVLGPLLALSPAKLVVANRTPQKATALARDFSALGDIEAIAFDALEGCHFDLVINGTAAGLADELPAIPAAPIGAGCFCYDMMYRLDAPTAFVEWSLAAGAGGAADGLGMLVEQAAEAFFTWRGVRPRSSEVIESLRAV